MENNNLNALKPKKKKPNRKAICYSVTQKSFQLIPCLFRMVVLPQKQGKIEKALRKNTYNI